MANAWDSNRLDEFAEWCSDIVDELNEHSRRLQPDPRALLVGDYQRDIMGSIHLIRAHAQRAELAARAHAAEQRILDIESIN